MDVLVTVFIYSLACIFLTIGTMKLTMQKDVFMKRMGVQGNWSGAVPNWMYKASGFFEILGAFGLVVPYVAGIADILIQLAAVGLIILMSIAVGVHVGINDHGNSMFKPIALVIALVIFEILYEIAR